MKQIYRKFWEGKRVLVTGHEGFLGSWLARTLLELGAKIVGVDIVKKERNYILGNLKAKIKNIQADVANLKLMKSIINKYRPEIVFHLAAQAIVGEAVKNPIQTFKSNIEGSWNILEACRGKKFVEAIVIASSDKAYGEHKKLPYKENASLKGSYPYDVSKSCADLLAYTYFRTYGVPICVTRCGNIFGPGDLHFSRIVPDLMRSIMRNKRFIIRSNGRFTRDYIYVEDVVRGYILLAEKMKRLKPSGQSFNFSYGLPISALELARTVYKMLNRKSDYAILNQVKYEIKHQYLSSQKARKILGWKPKFTTEKGLKKTIDWYRDYFRNK